jgi:NADPH:quinone reductase-like Zn-dependent oxidoreductase
VYSPEVAHLKPEDAVYGFVPLRGGTFAEYVLVKANEVARKPEALDYVQAAAVPLVALTAWQSLFDLAQLQSGERVLIHGATGGVGSFAVQLAKEKDAYVIGTQSERPLGQALGSISTSITAQRFEDVARRCRCGPRYSGGDTVERAYRAETRGRLVTTVSNPHQKPPRFGFMGPSPS